MVLEELGEQITQAIKQISNATIVDEKVLDECLNDIACALLQADVQFKLVQEMLSNVKKEIDLNDMAPGLNRRKITEQAIVHELCRMLEAGKPSFTLEKMKTSVIMFVGLQGSGKTTTCTKYAYYYKKKGWTPALVCADTFKTCGFDQLKQNAIKEKIPYYGSNFESDLVKTALEGVDKFRKENCDLIIIDTGGRHKLEHTLFDEMHQLCEATKPDLVVLVTDSSIGQAAFYQAEAFKKSVPVGAVILTKMDGHAKGGGALSSVAATKSPVLFIGTGENIDQLEAFDATAFVGRLLGKSDLLSLADEAREELSNDQPNNILRQITVGPLTFRKYQTFVNTSYQSLPLLSRYLPESSLRDDGPESIPAKIKKQLAMMESMTSEELDSSKGQLMDQSRISRIAHGAGCSMKDAMDMIEEFKNMRRFLRKKNLQNISQTMSPVVGTEAASVLQDMMQQLSSRIEVWTRDDNLIRSDRISDMIQL